jgi:UDPglucose 6-dehydrogenase
MTISVGIIGKGTVGKAVYDGLLYLGHKMSFYDPVYEGSTMEDVLDTDCVFICVPTDSTPEGDCDTSIVEKVVSELHEHDYRGLIAVKSTVIPGTSANLSKKYPHLRFASVPEFLRAKTALADFIHSHDVLVIGTNSAADFQLVKDIHGPFPHEVAKVSPTEAEIVKYFNNVHHAMQVTFANITYEVCKSLDSDYTNVYNAITKRTVINPAYLVCNENTRGFGGHCLPKDSKAWNNLIKKQGFDFQLIQAVLDDNQKFI